MSRIAELEAIISQTAYDYETDGTSELTDAEYDTLEAELRRLSPNSPVLKGVGAKLKQKTVKTPWTKVAHKQPMGSLDKVQTPEEFIGWMDGFKTEPWVICMPKFDGLSISLEYQNGQFVQAITRGDGTEGDDVTKNVRRIKFPQVIDESFTGFIRGEVMLKKSTFAKFFAGEKNPRNSAVGTLKRLDGAKCEHLSIFVYAVSGWDFACKLDELLFLEDMGFEKYPVSSGDAQTVLADYENFINGDRDDLDYEIDGLVIAIDSTEEREALGSHDMRPRGAIAFKFPHQEGYAIIEDIVDQVGSSGRIAPVAIFSPTLLAGASVSRASLHNMGYIGRLGGIRIGSKVRVSRRNDVIPAVEEVIAQGGGALYAPPTHCPECLTPLFFEGEYLLCKGDSCPAQKIGGIRNWIEKIGVLFFGEALIEALVANGKVQCIADLYRLTATEIGSLTYTDGRNIGMTTATKALDNLNAKKSLPLAILVGSLSIPLIGRSMVQMFVDAGFDTLGKMGNASLLELEAVPGVGPVKALAFYNGVRDRSAEICELHGLGVTAEAVVVKAPITGAMSGKTMVMTQFRDKDLAAAFEAAGGIVKDSVSKTTTYLVAKDISGGSSKLQAAAKNGTTVLDAAGMRALLGI